MGEARRDAAKPYAGVVLAAGESRRFGEPPKALAEVEGRPAVARLVDVLVEAGLDPVGVVVGAHCDRVVPVVERAGATAIVHAAWAEGRTGSIQAGIAWAHDADAIVLAPVDHPFVLARTVATLADAARRDRVSVWAQPTFGGASGHPVVIKAALFRAIADLGPDDPLNRIPRQLGVGLLKMPTRDPGVWLGTDSPEEYAKSRAVFRRLEEERWTGG